MCNTVRERRHEECAEDLKGGGQRAGEMAHSARVASHTATVRATNTILGTEQARDLASSHPPSLAGQGGRAHSVFEEECTSAVGVQNREHGADTANKVDVGGRTKEGGSATGFAIT